MAKQTDLALIEPTSNPAEQDPIFRRLIESIRDWKSQVTGIKIVDDSSFQVYGDLLVKVKNAEADAKLLLKKQIDAANKAHKSLTSLRKGVQDELAELHTALEEPMFAYRLAQKQASELATAASHSIIEDTQVELTHQAEELEARAAELKAGMNMAAARDLAAQAQALRSQSAVPMSVVIAADQKPAVAGLGEAWPWGGVVDDPMELIKAVADGRVPLMHERIKKGIPEQVPILIVNESLVDYLAKRYEKDLNLPGCHAEQSLQFRRQAE